MNKKNKIRTQNQIETLQKLTENTSEQELIQDLNNMNLSLNKFKNKSHTEKIIKTNSDLLTKLISYEEIKIKI